jgi:osmoprotectant transport system permease protein
MTALTNLLAENGPDSLVWWSWVGDHTDEIWYRTGQHVQLTVWAVAIGFVLSFSNVLYTIPSLALFGFLVPITHLGFRTAVIGLVSYTLLILVRNLVTAIDGVPDAVKEAADGMGYTRWRRFFAVDVRLATPTIIAGLRIATVTTVGLVTITAIVGQGGYGFFILDGINRDFRTPIVVGAVCSVVLAVALDLAFVFTERLLTPWAKRRARPA